jgi:DNA-binding NtrC family response regulator
MTAAVNAGPAGPSGASAVHASSVLVVDDEPDLLTLYELTLLREGLEVETAATVAQAREILQTRANKDGLAVIGTAEQVADHLGELADEVDLPASLITGVRSPCW